MNRIVRIHALGGPEQLRIEEAAPERPGPGEVLVRVAAIGLNNSEAQLRRGDYPMMRADLPTRIGREASGTVEAVGEGVRRVRPGDRVSTIPAFDVRRHGVYGDWCVVPEAGVVAAPAGLGHLEAAAVWQGLLTAYGPLRLHDRAGPGTTVLVVAAASGVGLLAVRLARLLGATVIGTTRTAGKRNAISAAGAHEAVVAGPEGLAAAVRAATDGRGFDIALDPVAGPGLADLVACAAPGARITLYGQLDAATTPLPLLDMLRGGISIRGYTLWEITRDPVRRADAVSFLSAELTRGGLGPTIDRTFRLDEIVEAHRHLESGRQVGKIVVDVAGGWP